MQQQLLQLFFTVSQVLLTPVMCALVLTSMWCIVLCGQTLREYFERWLRGKRWRSFMRLLRSGDVAPEVWQQSTAYDLHQWFARQVSNAAQFRQTLPEAEVRAHRRLGRLQILIRIGPMLGLIGTLIPLGPALQGLSTSSLVELGNNLNIAFTTTVFGIAIGAVAYALFVVQRGWFESDLAELEYLLAVWEAEDRQLGKEADSGKTHTPVG